MRMKQTTKATDDSQGILWMEGLEVQNGIDALIDSDD